MNLPTPSWTTASGGKRRALLLDRPHVLAIINVTPDSFSDGGAYPTLDAVVAAGARAIEEGAVGLDIGGESTRPGSQPVSAEEQIRRTAPAIRAIRRVLGDSFLISIDTTRRDVAQSALDEGADAVNDVSAGRDEAGMFALVAERHAGIILMHRLTQPSRDAYSTQYDASGAPHYPQGVVAEVKEFLVERVSQAEQAGIAPERIVIDPGLGFGKTIEQNLTLIRASAEFTSLGYPVLSGLSRKSFVGRVSGVTSDMPPSDRVFGTLALSVMHYASGARVFRVHDVQAHVEALRAASSMA